MTGPTVTPARALRNQAEALLRPADELAFTTDAASEPDVVLLAIARPAISFVMAIDKTEWSGIKTAELLGFQQAQPKKAKP